MKATRDTLARDLFLNVVRVHELLSADLHEFFREAGLTSTQYNVLRILRGGPKEGAPCQYIREHLLTRVPDVTRLVDRMEKAELVSRHRQTEDRRVVLIRLTLKGRKLCENLNAPLMRIHRGQTANLPLATLKRVNEDLERILAET